MADRVSYLHADPLAVQMRAEGWSLEVIDRVIERAAMLEHDGGEAARAACALAALEIDAVPYERRMHPATMATETGAAA